MRDNGRPLPDPDRPRLERIEWGVRGDIGGPEALSFSLFKRTVAGYQTVARWSDMRNHALPEPVLFDIVAAWTQRFTDDLVMSPGVQLVLPSGT